MAIEKVVEFLAATSQDESLRSGLAGVMGVGDGDISSASELDEGEAGALLGQRSLLVATFAEQNGYTFTVAELKAVIGVLQRYQAGELSGEEFSTALGLTNGAGAATGLLPSLGDTVDMVFKGIRYKMQKDTGSAHKVLDFLKKTAEDADFASELQEILAVGDGDISDFGALDADEVQALTGSRGALVAEFAARHGFVFTLADLLAVIDAFQRVQSGGLTPEEFDKFLRLNVKSKEFFPFIDNIVSMTYKGFGYSRAVASGSPDNTLAVVRFMERSESDEALQAKLAAVLGGDGNISSPSELDAEEAGALASGLSKRIVELGAEFGYLFSEADLSAAVGAFQLVNDGKLSEESCNRILGLGKPKGELAGVKKSAERIYRGVRY